MRIDEVGAHGVRQFDAVAPHDGQRVLAGRGVGHSGAGGDVDGLVAGHVGQQQVHEPRRTAGRGEPPALTSR